jgi:hypothetical protein
MSARNAARQMRRVYAKTIAFRLNRNPKWLNEPFIVKGGLLSR